MTACERCGRGYQPDRSTQRFCTSSCRKRAWDQKNGLHSGAAKRKTYGYEKRQVIGIDGEGVQDPDPHYIMLLASNGQGLVDGKGLSTEQCLSFLVSLPKTALKFFFSGNYDVNMMLGDWPPWVLTRLWRAIAAPDGKCCVFYEGWWIKWVPGKQFIVKDCRTGQSCCIWDVWSFVQRSFVDWLDQEGLASPEAIARIREMKDRRNEFDRATLGEIQVYCADEVQYLEAGVRRMLDLFRGAGIVPASYFGPGSLAGALMRKHGVDAYLADPPDQYQQLVAAAYRGGRFENAFIGWDDEGWAYDINSGYPDGARRLPCLKHSTWRHVERGPRTVHALARVEWDLGDPENTRWGPFPVLGAPITYPVAGNGWYWAEEVRSAQRVWPGRIRILEAVEIVQHCRHRPFAFIEDLFEQRRRLKDEDDPHQQVFKLAMNSIYGKLAQQVGTPRFQSFTWAGMTTAHCRAQILDAMGGDPDNVRMIATDGILTRYPLDNIVVGDRLGEWDAKQVRDILAIQPGLYYYRDETGEQYIRSRGFGRADLPIEEAQARIRRDRQPTLRSFLTGSIPVETRRFNGLGSVVRRKAWKQWRRWTTHRRNIRLNPWPKRGFLVPEQGRVETYAIDQAPSGTKPDAAGARRRLMEHDAEYEAVVEGGSLW